MVELGGRTVPVNSYCDGLHAAFAVRYRGRCAVGIDQTVLRLVFLHVRGTSTTVRRDCAVKSVTSSCIQKHR
jgi:hypothetical protein